MYMHILRPEATSMHHLIIEISEEMFIMLETVATQELSLQHGNLSTQL